MTDLISSPSGDAQVVADLAQQAAARTAFPIVEGKTLGVITEPGQTLTTFDLTKYSETPERKTGRVGLSDADSFVLYILRHKAPDETTVWANVDAGTLIAVLNDHTNLTDDGGWADHRATLQLKYTEDWKFWLGMDGKLLPQTAFAEHLEEGALNIIDPSAADMLEIAQSFQAKRGVSFKSSTRLKSGEVGLQYEETTDARAGVKGTIEIPDSFTLKLQPFDGGPEFTDITARFRYRIVDGVLTLGYKVNRPDLVARAAFNEITASVSEGIQLPVMAGVPRS
jgi:uncharacterized protein YfdQ (DUF2303 family)